MIANIKQKKIKIEPRIKLNYNTYTVANAIVHALRAYLSIARENRGKHKASFTALPLLGCEKKRQLLLFGL